MTLDVLPETKYVAVLRVQGDIDAESSGRLMVEVQGLLARGVRVVMLDLTECAYMSSTGLAALSSIFKQMRDLTRAEAEASWAVKNTLERAGELGPTRQLLLVNPNASVRRVLSLAGIETFITIYANLTQARAALL